MAKVLYAGSFDPITNGHADIIRRASGIFEVVIGVAVNSDKKYMFSLEQRVDMIKSVFPKLEVKSYETLTKDFCFENDIKYLLRGIRNEVDFNYENSLEAFNNHFGLETIYMRTAPHYSHVSSTLVRELIKSGVDDLQCLVPMEIMNKIF